jgi:hypothetical protein
MEVVMKKSILSLLTMATLALTLAATASADILYVNGKDLSVPGGSGFFGSIDTSTGTYTNIAFFGYSHANLLWNGNSFYTINDYPDGSSSLKTIDNSGAVTDIGTTGGGPPFFSPVILPGKTISGMAYNATNATTYAYAYMDDALATINTTTGNLAEIAAPGSSGLYGGNQVGGKLAIVNNVLYGSLESYGVGNFGTFNTDSGLFTSLATAPIYKEMNIFTDGATLYGLTSKASSTNSLYTIDPVTGAVTLDKAITGSVPNYWSGASFASYGSAAVPEPTTYALLCISLGVVGYARKKMGKREA